MSDVRIVDDAIDAILASREAEKDFLERLEAYGLTVLEDTRMKWWKFSYE